MKRCPLTAQSHRHMIKGGHFLIKPCMIKGWHDMTVAAMNQGLPTAKVSPCEALAVSTGCSKLWVWPCGGQAPASGSLQPTV
ncbi:hypothetical protein E2C01_015570 [Portunus trituberculatus]|uniref:Uncharacterized protein n=1 Tax=Portunus trituberculatus TaxID=210409 RepID=A0A5B7DNF5_PORTR|nr:hypothetical protein [Portunus trituberculatus]